MEALKPSTVTRSCATCVHFMPSTKEQPSRGLCAFYSLIRSKDDGCRHGYTPRQQGVKVKNRAGS